MEITHLKKIAVFASGRGSNFAAVLTQIEAGNIAGGIVCVISDRAEAPVFDIARQHDIPIHWINRKQFSAAGDYVTFLLKVLESYQTELILLAGYLKLIPSPVVEQYRHAIINIHPALLPNFGGKGFYGLRVHQAVIDSGVKITGVSIHFVDEHYDRGSIIIQEKVPVLVGDNAEVLAARVLKVEHRLLPKVVKAYCEDRLKVVNNKVVWEK